MGADEDDVLRIGSANVVTGVSCRRRHSHSCTARAPVRRRHRDRLYLTKPDPPQTSAACLPLSQPASRHSSLLLAPRHRHPLADLLLHPAAPDWVLLAFICVHRTTRALCGPCRRASRCRAARRRSSLALRSPGTAIPPRKRSSPASMWHDFHGRVKLRFCSGCAVLCQRDRGPPHRQPQRHREAVAHVDAEPTPSRGRFYAAGADARRADTHHCRSIGRLHRERRQRCQGQAEAVVAGTARRVLACRRAAGRWGGTAASSFHADVN